MNTQDAIAHLEAQGYSVQPQRCPECHGNGIVPTGGCSPDGLSGHETERSRAIILLCTVRCIDLFPERNDGADVADFFDDAHTVDELLALVEIAPRTLGEIFSGSRGEDDPGETFPGRVGEIYPPELTKELTTKLRRKRKSVRSSLVAPDRRSPDSASDSSTNEPSVEKPRARADVYNYAQSILSVKVSCSHRLVTATPLKRAVILRVFMQSVHNGPKQDDP